MSSKERNLIRNLLHRSAWRNEGFTGTASKLAWKEVINPNLTRAKYLTAKDGILFAELVNPLCLRQRLIEWTT
jgi:adenine specific DNA methylase Mod